LLQAKVDGTYSKLLVQLAKQDLLILDDWGLEPLDTAQRNDMMEIMDDRNDASSTITINQLPVDRKQWDGLFLTHLTNRRQCARLVSE